MKKLLFSLLTLGVVISVLPMFAAFEAHVINVTAKIENALSVPISEIKFGTVFPQEHLDQPLDITLSGSFLADDQTRVNAVSYFIRQKPKCAVTTNDGTVLVGPTATGHIQVGDNPATEAVETYWIDCGPAPRQLTTDESWGVLPSLCPYLSKHSEPAAEGFEDGSLPSFHTPWKIVNNEINWNDVHGTLTKPSDRNDHWTIDLAVPCFGGYCAQDWADFVHHVNPDAGDPAQWAQPASNEHKIFGCDLWVEVDGVTNTSDNE